MGGGVETTEFSLLRDGGSPCPTGQKLLIHTGKSLINPVTLTNLKYML